VSDEVEVGVERRSLAVADLASRPSGHAWRRRLIGFAEPISAHTDLDFRRHDGAGTPISLRELLVHMIEEYAATTARRPAARANRRAHRQ